MFISRTLSAVASCTGIEQTHYLGGGGGGGGEIIFKGSDWHGFVKLL